ncbi:unnamed protein product [Tenebrio molitor]|nr:unnamed protein product [Tenebrio molitor]
MTETSCSRIFLFSMWLCNVLLYIHNYKLLAKYKRLLTPMKPFPTLSKVVFGHIFQSFIGL